jgi:predicted Fe-Mo cluster-binding NifX family protein
MGSTIYGHFASAPLFVIIDSRTRQSTAVANCDPENPYGGCNPFSALRGRQLDGIVVGGIGDESVRVMNLCGFRVYQAQSPAVADNVALFEKDGLPEVTVQQSHLEGRCSGGEGHACSHSH